MAKIKTKRIFAHCKRAKGEMVVQNGLAVTPSQAMALAKQGLPSNGLNASLFTEGHTGSDFELALDERRGVDVATIWQETQNLKSKFRNAHKAAPELQKGE